MPDFRQNSQTKNAVRILASPIADVAAFNLIVQSVIADNPFGCVEYMTAGENHAGFIIHLTPPYLKCSCNRRTFMT